MGLHQISHSSPQFSITAWTCSINDQLKISQPESFKWMLNLFCLWACIPFVKCHSGGSEGAVAFQRVRYDADRPWCWHWALSLRTACTHWILPSYACCVMLWLCLTTKCNWQNLRVRHRWAIVSHPRALGHPMIRHGPAANDERTISRTGEFLGVTSSAAAASSHHRHSLGYTRSIRPSSSSWCSKSQRTKTCGGLSKGF